ncbi:MAG: trypsin-like serine protease [Kofleriaceae bacterium]
MRTAIAFALLGCTEVTTGVAAQPIVGGVVSPQDQATVALVGPRGVFCSGVLVESTRVITAAHCLPPHITEPIEAVEVFFGADITQGGVRIAILEARAHPAWQPDSFTDDIGIIELVEPSAIGPVAVGSTAGLTGGDTLRAVGYGVSQAAGVPGVKRTGELIVDTIDASTIELFADPAVTCNGDSGGPVFAGDAVVGINSRSNCETAALAERVDAHADFLAGDANVVGGCSTTPSPPLLLLLVIIAWCRVGFGCASSRSRSAARPRMWS